MANSGAEDGLSPEVDRLVYIFRPNNDIVEKSIEEFYPDDFPDTRFRWFHLPVNDMVSVKKCFEKCNYEVDPTLKVRPALSKFIDIPLHSRHMEPSCSEGNHATANANTASTADNADTNLQLSTPRPTKVDSATEDAQLPLLALYLPYMNWETYQNYRSLHTKYIRYERNRQPRTAPATASESETSHHELSQPPLHPRRTLDQFYYSSLADTTVRDADQTISKWTGSHIDQEGRARAGNDSLLIMIDQLWCWVLDERTILSCFPSHNHSYSQNGKFRDLYPSIQQNVDGCTTVWDMYSLLVKEAITYLFSQKNRGFTDLIETYRWVTGKKAAYQTTYFQEFHQNHSNGESGSTFLDDRPELKLVLEVADINDELKMIRHLVDKQREVLKSLISTLRKFNPSQNEFRPEQISNVQVGDVECYDRGTFIVNVQNHQGKVDGVENTRILSQGVSGAARDHVVSADEMLVSLLTEIDVIMNDAEYTHKMLLDLLDLKQKTASLAEARSTTQQGRAVMLFTIVTVIFLPLSFFTSYFGQNVSEITGDNRNPSTWGLWRIGAPISLVVILLALLIAYYITKPDSQLWCWRRSRHSRDRDSCV